MTYDGVRRAQFAWYWAITTVVACCAAFVWYISPLGIGFADWPDEPLRSVVQAVYLGSYFVGIPALLGGQLLSLGLAVFRKRRAAFIVPAISLGLFFTSVAFVMTFVG
jgi:hypothetical protein